MDLENIKEAVSSFEGFFFNNTEFFSDRKNADLLLKIKLLNSEIKDKQEIHDKLDILCYHLGLLKTTKISKDYKSTKLCINHFTKNEFTKVEKVMEDVKNFGDKIKNLKNHYNSLLSQNPLTLDFKIHLEPEYKKHISFLEQINQKQKEILIHIGKNFVSATKELMKDKECKRFLEKET